MINASAWIISITPTLTVSVGEFELVYILPDKPILHKIPKSPPYCEHVIVWENKIIPVMDLSVRLGFTAETCSSNKNTIVGIFAYRAEDTGKPGFGAFFMNATPRRCEVNNTQSCDLPDKFKHWRRYVSSSFKIEDNDEETVIIRLNRLFLS